MSKYENQMKYDKKNTKDIRLKLNINTDKDILDFLEKSGNKQGTIKEALRKYMEDLKMIIIERSNDKEVYFDDLEKAKEYMIPADELSEEDYLGDDFESYAKSLKNTRQSLKTPKASKSWRRFGISTRIHSTTALNLKLRR